MLPDGETINVGVERFLAPEAFFNPSVIGKELEPMDDVIVGSISECDVDLRRDLYSNIVLSGGSTMFPGIKERLTKEIKEQIPESVDVKIIAPSMWMLLSLNSNSEIIPSVYAKAAKAAGLDIITWTIERSGLLKNGGGWYYQTVADVINNDGDMLDIIDVLAQDIGVLGIFSDWPATVTYYANCKRLKSNSEKR